MIVLGIHDGHNASAALLRDGRVLAAVQEERISGIKNHSGTPTLAIAEVLRLAGVSWAEVERVALHSRHMPVARSRDELVAHYRNVGRFSGRLRGFLRQTPINQLYRERRRRQRMADLVQAGVPMDKLTVVDHHTAHAAAAYFGAPWRDEAVLVLTCDGAGDDLCATVSVGRGLSLERKYAIPEAESLGNVYALVTFLLGMVPNEHEYKLMGMAPYAPEEGVARSRGVFDRLVQFDQGGEPRWSRQPRVPATYYSLEWLKASLEFHRFDWICGAVQNWIEDALVEWVRRAIRVTGIRKLALGGGVFMNVKANQRIMELDEVDSLFVFPSCGDESNAIGSAYWLTAETLGERGGGAGTIPPLTDVYWGADILPTDIDAVLRPLAGSARIQRHGDIETVVADLIAGGQVVARCKGRSEFGARALGNRSILADPANPLVIRIINDMIKNRDFWMPFASSMLAERQHEYIRNPKRIASPYMILAFPSTDRINEFRAGAHPYDLTVRPQTVDRDWNPDYHRLISRFAERTGKAVVLNTSYNLHGFPMVSSAKDAVHVFEHSGLDHLALGQYLISKPSGAGD